MHPALASWVATVKELLPRARPSGQAGLVYLPGGDEDYSRAIRIYTTLPLTADTLHQTGLDHVAALEDRAVRLGAGLGLTGLDQVRAALRDSAGRLPADEAVRQAVAAVRRAEAQAPEFFPAPLPPPCAVTPMPDVVAVSGTAPHYTPPRQDGGRPGTFWFNTERPTAGTGWDIEVVAFHEAVPGHHLQLSRLQLLTTLPDLQRQRSLPVFSEGWGLYAEQLAEETGLYADERGLLGSISTSLMRAARLVVDTGIHAFGWSRERALGYMTEHVPMPPEFLAAEIDRYVVMPGQALAYLTGKLEILRIREEARQRLGPAFTLPAFHGAILDHGSLPDAHPGPQHRQLAGSGIGLKLAARVAEGVQPGQVQHGDPAVAGGDDPLRAQVAQHPVHAGFRRAGQRRELRLGQRPPDHRPVPGGRAVHHRDLVEHPVQPGLHAAFAEIDPPRVG